MIKKNILSVRERIHLVCSRMDQDSGAVTLVAVSKNRSVRADTRSARRRHNRYRREQGSEALAKHKELQADKLSIKWHMVGHLQTNKVKDAVRIFDLIHSVDSIRLAQEIDKQAAKIDKVQDVLIEVKTSSEAAKSGVTADEAPFLAKDIASLKNITVRGLMTIAPLTDDIEKVRFVSGSLKGSKVQ